MTRNIIIGIIVIIFLVIVAAIIESAMRPKPFTWYPTYNNLDKEPYGGFVIFTQLNDFFPGKKVKRLTNKDLLHYQEVEYTEVVADTIVVEKDEYLYEEMEEDTSFSVYFEDSIYTAPFNFFFLSNTFIGSDEKIAAILQHVHQGNDALIVTSYMGYRIQHFLGIEIADEGFSHIGDSSETAYSIDYKGDISIDFKPQEYYNYFRHYPEDAEVIAKNGYDQVVGLTLPLGKGKITLFSLPIIFTNYYILKEDNRIAEDLLTSLPLKDTYWSQNLYGAFGTNYPEKRSILGFIHSNESLTWAFYTLLFTLLVYFMFQIRRTQKVIPVVSPPENTSVKFLEVLGNLYLDKKDHKDMVIKKMNYFLMWVRDDIHLDTSKINEEFMIKLSHKTNVKLGIIKLLFERYDRCTRQPYVSGEDFVLVNKLFQDFKHKDNE